MKRPPAIFYGWFIVAVGIMAFALGYGARYSFSVIFPSLLDEFHWPRDTTSIMLSSHLLLYGLAAPLAGRLVDRIGPRRTMVSGALLLSLGLALSAGGRSPWHFYLSFGAISGVGLCLIGSVPLTTVLRNWFERKRGLAFSLLFFGSGGAFVLYPAVAALIKTAGWRYTFVVEAIVVAGVMVPLILRVVRYHPREKGLTPDGLVEDDGGASTSRRVVIQVVDHAWAKVDWTLPKAARTGRFWLLCLSTFSMWGITEHILVGHHVAFAMDLGYSRVYASFVLSLFGIFFSLGSLAGFVSDRIGREPTLTIGTLIGIAGIFVLTLMNVTSHPWMLFFYAITLGFGLGISGPAIAAATTDIFQGARVGTIIGFVWLSFSVGGCIGPWLGGWIFELSHSYEIAFVVAMVFYVVACIAIWLAAPRKVRLVAGRAKTREDLSG